MVTDLAPITRIGALGALAYAAFAVVEGSALPALDVRGRGVWVPGVLAVVVGVGAVVVLRSMFGDEEEGVYDAE